jgi:protein SCO1/2
MDLRSRRDGVKNRRTIRSGWQAAILCCALLSAPVFAQVSSYGDKQNGENSGDQLPQVLQKVGVSQHLNQQLPLDAGFVDESGKPVKLGDYFGKKPAILALVYYTCPMLC